jgi:hypothetical protein
MNYDLYARAIELVFNGSFRRQLAVALGEQIARNVMQKAKRNYSEIVTHSPPIGGRKNPLTMNLLITAYAAAIYKAANGKVSPEKMGEVFSDAIERTVAFWLFTKAMAKKVFTRQWQDRRNALAIESQTKAYPADFVWEFVYGKSVNEYGINYRECGIYKMFERENCTELASQMCKFDYVTAKYMGCELTRTKTIANGDGLCDFWYTKKQDHAGLTRQPV